MIDQLLQRKRLDLLRSWEEREARLQKARLKEKSQEAFASKRRRIDIGKRKGADDDDEEEWLLDDANDRGPPDKDALSGLSKESRDVLTRIGLGSTIKREEDADLLQEPVKVRSSSRSRNAWHCSDQSRSTSHRVRTPSFHNSSESSDAQLSRLHFPNH